MAASKRLIQLGSRLRAIHVGSTLNAPSIPSPLRRTSVNSYRSFFSRSDCCKKHDQLKEIHEHVSIQAGSTMNTAPLRRNWFNSHRLFSSSSSGNGLESRTKQDQGLELASLRREYTKLQYEIGKMREKLENKDTVSHLKTELQVRDMSEITKKLISEAKKSAIKYSISATRLVRGALEELLTVSPHEAVNITLVEALLVYATAQSIVLLVPCAFFIVFLIGTWIIWEIMKWYNDSKDQNGRKGQVGLQ